VGKLKSKCIVKDCPNKRSQGEFIGDLCAPCHNFITTGKADFGNCQAARNAVSFAASGLNKLIETHARQVAVILRSASEPGDFQAVAQQQKGTRVPPSGKESQWYLLAIQGQGPVIVKRGARHQMFNALRKTLRRDGTSYGVFAVDSKEGRLAQKLAAQWKDGWKKRKPPYEEVMEDNL